MEETKGRIKDNLPEDHQNSKGVRYLERITHPLNVIHVIIWDTLLEIALLRKINSRRRTKSSMPMQPNKMNKIRRGIEKISTLVKSMS